MAPKGESTKKKPAAKAKGSASTKKDTVTNSVVGYFIYFNYRRYLFQKKSSGTKDEAKQEKVHTFSQLHAIIVEYQDETDDVTTITKEETPTTTSSKEEATSSKEETTTTTASRPRRGKRKAPEPKEEETKEETKPKRKKRGSKK